MALLRIDNPDNSIQWSSPFSIHKFFEVKEDPKKKQKRTTMSKCLVSHQKRFSMIFVEPSSFFTGSDICIKSPVIVKNCLPFDILIRTKKVLDYQHKAYEINEQENDEEESQTEITPISDKQMKEPSRSKEIIDSEEQKETTLIEPGKAFSFHNFHLNKEIKFELNVGIRGVRQTKAKERTAQSILFDNSQSKD